MKTRGKKGKKASGAEARDRSGQATTRSTAGPGFAFEDQVAAWLLLKMLTGETIPGMDGCLGLRLQSQTSALEWLNKGSSLRLTFDSRCSKKKDYVEAIKNRISWSLVPCHESRKAGRRNFY